MKKGISLIGMPGAGKTTVGRVLAAKLGFEFIDLDELIVLKTGMLLNEYLDQNGEEKFLDLEKQLILDLNLLNKVFSPGGSIIYEGEAMGKLKAETMVIYLNVPLFILKKRRISKARGVVGLGRHSLSYLFKERSILYEKYSDVTIDIGDESVDLIVKRILDSIRS